MFAQITYPYYMIPHAIVWSLLTTAANADANIYFGILVQRKR